MWADLQPDSWSNAISEPDNIFAALYEFSKSLIEREIDMMEHDLVIEVGKCIYEYIISLVDIRLVGWLWYW